ncbi:sugar phosphate nucleotidyltransferase [[Eubacterium] cellulosolvens]
MMKALILAGGFATRLRPLSCQKPKLLFPIAGMPLLERTIGTLSKAGVTEIVLAVNYLAEVLAAHFGNQYAGVKIQYSREISPLGTAGPIKKAERILKMSDPFLVFNGDILFESELREMIQQHKKDRAIATIALKKVEDPSRFGVVVFDSDRRVSQFIEKPPKESAPSNYINAGIYVISPKIFKYIPAGKKCSTEKEVYPILAEKRGLYAHIYQGAWFDIGKFDDYRSANWHYLKKISIKRPAIRENVSIQSSSDIRPPVLVGKKSVIGENAHIGPNTIIGSKNTIGRRTIIRDSILFDNVVVGDSSILEGCILGDAVNIGDYVHLGKEVVIADGVSVADHVKIVDDTHICPHKEITSDVREPGFIK